MPLTSVKEIFEEIKLEIIDYFSAKGDIIQLKAAEKGSPIVAKTIYTSILAMLGIIAGTIALLTVIFALSLIFLENGTDPFTAVRGLTFGALCLFVFFLLVIFILLAVRANFIRSMEINMINRVIDQQEKREREKVLEPSTTPLPNSEEFTTINNSDEEGL